MQRRQRLSDGPHDVQPRTLASGKLPSPARLSPNETARSLLQRTRELPNGNASTAASGDGGTSSVEDAPLSNRASETCNRDPSFQLLRQTIDSLEVSFRGEPRPDIWEQLRQLKEVAQSPELRLQATAQLQLGEDVFEVGDKGAGRFPFVLSDGRFRIRMGRGESMPVALVQIRSDYLACAGPVKALTDAASVVALLVAVESVETVSRVDLAVDFCSAANMESWPRAAWVTRAEHKDAHAVGDHFTGWSIGLAGDISARLYDKTFEIATESYKYYLRDLWEVAGWFPADAVWRLEFQLWRPALARFNIRTLDELLASLDGLWSYLTANWLRLCVPNAQDATRSRWQLHPLWTALRAITWEGSSVPLVAQRPNSNIPSNKWIARHATGVLVSQMAKAGTVDMDKGWELVRSTTEGYWQGKGEWEGASAEDLILERVRARGRKYGTLINLYRDRVAAANTARQAEAALYRKVSGGRCGRCRR